jgi:hypothetical protein
MGAEATAKELPRPGFRLTFRRRSRTIRRRCSGRTGREAAIHQLQLGLRVLVLFGGVIVFFLALWLLAEAVFYGSGYLSR